MAGERAIAFIFGSGEMKRTYSKKRISRRSVRMSVAIAATSAVVLSSIHQSAFGAASSWTFVGTNGTWQTNSNWLGGVPTASIDAIFNQNSSYAVNFGAAPGA